MFSLRRLFIALIATEGLAVVSATTCNADNCLRPLRDARVSSSASAFCATYTTDSNPQAFPTYLSGCQSLPSRISSACSCLVSATSTSSRSTQSTQSPPSPTTPPTSFPDCHEDNCYRALQNPRYSIPAAAFCSSYTTTLNTAPSAIPSYLSNCHGSPTELSSACSCVHPTATTTSSSSVTSPACSSLPSPAATDCGSTLSGASNGRAYRVQCGLAYTGSSSLVATTASSYESCFTQCGQNSKCAAFTFDSSICLNNCQLFAFTDDIISTSSSDTTNSGFTPANARDYTCDRSICGTAVFGEGRFNDGYLVACRSSYSFSQPSDVDGSPFTAVSFKDCLTQCDNNGACNYMSFDSSIFSSNCAMFSRGGVSVDVFGADARVDSAKALVGQRGGETVYLSPSDLSTCPVYDAASGTCMTPPNGGKLQPLHYSRFTYTAACRTRYFEKAGAVISTLTVNTFAQCLDSCDKNNHCDYMTFKNSLLSPTTSFDNCRFISGDADPGISILGTYDSATYP